MRSVRADPEAVRRLYRTRNLTLATLAERAQVHERTLRNVLSGRAVDEHTVVRLAGALTAASPGEPVTVADLLLSDDGSDERAAPSQGGPRDASIGGAGRWGWPARSNLPAAVPLVGRDGLAALVENALACPGGPRSVCLTGPPGIGKTALALSVSHALLEGGSFSSVVWVAAKAAELTARRVVRTPPTLSSLADLILAVGHVLGNREIGRLDERAQRQAVYNLLAQNTALLVLDNLEDLDDEEIARIDVFARTLPPSTRMLLTSRYPTGICGVRDVIVPPLSRDDACRLLAREASNKGIYLEPDDSARAFERVGGIPVLLLWIVGRTSFEGGTIGTALGMAAEEGGDIYEWCFARAWRALPSDTHRRLLVAAALCRGPASRELLGAISALSDDARDTALGGLWARASLLQRDGDSDRFWVLPVTRGFALSELEHLPDAASFPLRAVAHLTAYAEQHGGIQRDLFHRLDEERENLLGVADWCCDTGEWAALARLFSAMVDYLYERGYWASLLRYGKALSGEEEVIGDPPLYAAILRAMSWMSIEMADYRAAAAFADAALRIASRIGDARLQATALRYLGDIAFREKRLGSAAEWFERSRAAAGKVTPNDDLLAMLENYMGAVAEARGDYQRAVGHFRASLRHRRRIGDRFGTCAVLRNLGELARASGDRAWARRILRGCIRFCHVVPREDMEAGATLLLAMAEADDGNLTEAQRLAEAAAAIYERRGQAADLDLASALIRDLEARRAPA